jgi:hypothetical protein
VEDFMAAIASPYGLRPVQLLGGLPYAGGIRSFPLTANSVKAFFFGDPVGLVAGNPVALTASPTTTGGPNSPIGVFMGCEWEDPIRGFVNAQSFPANGFLSGLKKIRFKILDSPNAVFAAQANGPVTIDKVGMNCALVAVGTGNAATGDSLVGVDAAAAATATLAVRIVGFPDKPGSQPGDAFTDLLVTWNFGVHRYTNPTGL